MKVIFLKDVPRVGKAHDLKEVNDGYAMNFLLPRGLAERATPKAMVELEVRKREVVVQREVQAELLAKNLEEIKDKVVHMKAKADNKGHLFSAIHPDQITGAMKAEHRADISPEFISLEKPIKAVGEFEIPIVIKNNRSSFKLVVEAL